MAGTLTISTLSDGTNSTSSTNCIQGSAKAWVNFNGTGTVAIRASYNVSSITDNGTGAYTVNFTNAITDANYVTVVNAVYPASAGSNNTPFAGVNRNTAQTTSAVQINTNTQADTLVDTATVAVAVFR
jgi:hypothetical protein